MEIRLLIVDDHPVYRAGLRAALAHHLVGVQILEAGSAEEALQRLDSGEDIDLALIDQRLPGMDGLHALDALAARHPTVARVLISGAEEPALAQVARRHGASGFIDKTTSVASMVRAIEVICAGGQWFGSGLAGAVGLAPADDAASQLTVRQIEVLQLLARGMSNKEVMRELAIAERTVKAHVTAIFAALGVSNRTQAVLAASRLGLVSLPR